jgi:hypothetical protein
LKRSLKCRYFSLKFNFMVTHLPIGGTFKKAREKGLKAFLLRGDVKVSPKRAMQRNRRVAVIVCKGLE